MTTEERVLRLENAFVMLTELVRNAEERSDDHDKWINELGAAQANSEAKIAALADAQIKNESAIASLTLKMAALADAQVKTEEALAGLATAQAATDRRLNNLITLFEQHKG